MNNLPFCKQNLEQVVAVRFSKTADTVDFITQNGMINMNLSFCHNIHPLAIDGKDQTGEDDKSIFPFDESASFLVMQLLSEMVGGTFQLHNNDCCLEFRKVEKQ